MRRFRAIDTSRGAYDYPVVGEYLEIIARSALAAGVGREVTVLGAECHLFSARALVAYAVAWIEDCMASVRPSPGA